jgi:hypothetical protein
MYSREQLISIIDRDPTLTKAEKDEVIERLRDNSFYDHMIHGAIGASIGYVIARFLKLSKTSQVLLSIAGFGLGKYLLDATRKHDRFLQYNDRLKVYELKD